MKIYCPRGVVRNFSVIRFLILTIVFVYKPIFFPDRVFRLFTDFIKIRI